MTLRHDRISCSDLCQSCFFSDLLFRIETGSTILGPQYTKCHAVLGSCDLSCHHSRPRTRSARAKVDFWLHRINVENYMKRCKRDPVEQGSPTELRCHTLCLQYKIHQAHAVPFLAPLATVTQRCQRRKKQKWCAPSPRLRLLLTRAMLQNTSSHLA